MLRGLRIAETQSSHSRKTDPAACLIAGIKGRGCKSGPASLLYRFSASNARHREDRKWQPNTVTISNAKRFRSSTPSTEPPGAVVVFLASLPVGQ